MQGELICVHLLFIIQELTPPIIATQPPTEDATSIIMQLANTPSMSVLIYNNNINEVTRYQSKDL